MSSAPSATEPLPSATVPPPVQTTVQPPPVQPPAPTTAPPPVQPPAQPSVEPSAPPPVVEVPSAVPTIVTGPTAAPSPVRLPGNVGTFVPRSRTTVQPTQTGGFTTAVPNPNADTSSGSLSTGSIVAISVISVAVVLAALSIFAFKMYVSRPKKRNAKVELGDAFGKPLTDNIFQGSSSVQGSAQEQIPLESVKEPLYVDANQYHQNAQYYYGNGTESSFNHHQYQEGGRLTMNEYLAVNGNEWDQYERYYEPNQVYYQPSHDVSDQGVVEAVDPFTIQQQDYEYPTQTRYESVPEDPFKSS